MGNLEHVAALIEEHYFLAEKAHEYAAFLRFHAGKYAQAKRDGEFAEILNRDLFAMSHDLHLCLDVRAKSIRDERDPIAQSTFTERGIALIKLARFPAVRPESDASTRSIVEAFRFATTASSVIIDIRHNPGGDGSSVALATSYLLANPPVLLAIYRGRTPRTSNESWTWENLPGEVTASLRPLADKPVCVLVSKKTFSAAEEFAYNLQQLKRATIIGETTRGGAHPSRRYPITDNLTLTVPFAETINPISNANWEGVGVIPDIPCPASKALMHAIDFIRRDVLRTSPSSAN